jgi:tetratricopeptide (TPR) repeat protein
MKEQDINLLDAYFNGLLAENEAEQVRQRAAADPEFAAALQLREEMEQWLGQEPGRQAVAETLTAVGKDFFREKVEAPPLKVLSVNWKRTLLLAASFALLLVATWYLGSPKQPAYEQYAMHTPISFTERGENEALQNAAETDFKNGKYAGALTSLEALLRQNPDDLIAALYKGICLIELNRPAEARSVLQPLASGTSALRADAQWYIALSYLKEKNTEQCKAALQQIGAGMDHYEKAQELLKKLE